MSRMLTVFLVVTFLGVNASAQNNVGVITDLKGTARLKNVDGKVETLTEKNFKRSLQPNQQLRPDKNGQMRIALCDGTSPIVPAGKWYPVPAAVVCTAPPDSSIRRILANKFNIGGRHRGKESFILFPIESEKLMDTIRPETALIRWVSSKAAKINLSVSVVGVEHAAAWERDGLSGADGSFSDDGLRGFLQDVREKHPDAKLQLKIRSSFNTENSAIFQLLPKEKEAALKQGLANLKEEEGLLSHLFRAELYLRYDLFVEAAAEYEEALKFSPESVELLRDTAILEEQAGDLKRSRELESYIEELSNGPN